MSSPKFALLGAALALVSAPFVSAACFTGGCIDGGALNPNNRLLGNKTIDTGVNGYRVGSYNGTTCLDAGSFNWNNNNGAITYWSQWSLKNGTSAQNNYMQWVKKEQGYSSGYPKAIDSISGAKTVSFNTTLTKTCGAAYHASRFGIDIWTRRSDGTKTEIMINQQPFGSPPAGVPLAATVVIPGSGDSTSYNIYGPYDNDNANGYHRSYSINRTTARDDGSVDVAAVLRYLRTNHSLQNESVLEIRVGREGVSSTNGSFGEFRINSVSIPNL